MVADIICERPLRVVIVTAVIEKEVIVTIVIVTVVMVVIVTVVAVVTVAVVALAILTYFIKDNLTPIQPMRCSQGSILQLSQCFVLIRKLPDGYKHICRL